LVRVEQEGLDLADVAEILVGELEALERLESLAGELLAALRQRREEDLPDLAVLSAPGSGGSELFDRDGLAVGELVAGAAGLGGAQGDASGEVGRGFLGAR
jgi:hypothetical protein